MGVFKNQLGRKFTWSAIFAVAVVARAETVPIAPEICADWMAREGYLLRDVERKDGSVPALPAGRARELLRFDPEAEAWVEKPRYYAYAKMDENARSALGEIEADLGRPGSALSRYMGDCAKDDFLCHDHFTPANARHLGWYCSLYGRAALLGQALSTYETYAESCDHPAAVYSTDQEFSNFESNPAYVSNCLGSRARGREESAADATARRRARVAMWRASAAFVRARFAAAKDEFVGFKDRATSPDAAIFVLAKLREEMQDHRRLAARRRSYEFGRALLSSTQPPYAYPELAHAAASLDREGNALVSEYLAGLKGRRVFRDDGGRKVLYAQGYEAGTAREPTLDELVARVRRVEDQMYRKLHRYAVPERYRDAVIPYLAFYLRKLDLATMRRIVRSPGQLASWSEGTLCYEGNPYAVCTWANRPLRDKIYVAFYHEMAPCANEGSSECPAVVDNRGYHRSSVYDEETIRDWEGKLRDLNGFCYARRKGAAYVPTEKDGAEYAQAFAKAFGSKEGMFLSMFEEFKDAVVWIDPDRQLRQCYQKGWVFRSALPRQPFYDIEHEIAAKLHEAIAYTDWGSKATYIGDVREFVKKTTLFYTDAIKRAAEADENVSAEMGVFVTEFLLNGAQRARFRRDAGFMALTLLPAAGVLRATLLLRGVELTATQLQILSMISALGVSATTGIYQVQRVNGMIRDVEEAWITGQYDAAETESVLAQLRGDLKISWLCLGAAFAMASPALVKIVRNGARYASIPLRSLFDGKYREAINRSKMLLLRRLNRDPVSNAFITEAGVIDEILLLSDEAQAEIAEAMKHGRGAQSILANHPGTRLAALVERAAGAASRTGWLQRNVFGPLAAFYHRAITKTYRFFGTISPWARKQWLLRMFREAGNDAENHEALRLILEDLLKTGRMTERQADDVIALFNLRAKDKFLYLRQGAGVAYQMVFDEHLERLVGGLRIAGADAPRIAAEMREFLFRNLSVAQMRNLASSFRGVIESERDFKAFQRAVGYALWLRGKSKDFLFLSRLGWSSRANLQRAVDNFGEEFDELYALSRAIKGHEEDLLASFGANPAAVVFRAFDVDAYLATRSLRHLSADAAQEFAAFQARYSKKFYEEFARRIARGTQSWDEMVDASRTFARMHREAAEMCKFPSVANAFSRSAFTTMVVGASLAGKSIAYWQEHGDDPSDPLRIGAKGLIDLTTYVLVKQLKMLNFAGDPYRAAGPIIGKDYGYAIAGRGIDVTMISPILGEFYLNNDDVKYQKLVESIRAESVDGILAELEKIIGETHPELLAEAEAYVASVPNARDPAELQDILFWDGLKLAKDDPMNRFRNLQVELSEALADAQYHARLDAEPDDAIAYAMQAPADAVEDASWAKPIARFTFYAGFDGLDVVKSFFINRLVLQLFCSPRVQLTPAAGNAVAVAFAFIEKYVVSRYVEYPLRRAYIKD